MADDAPILMKRRGDHLEPCAELDARNLRKFDGGKSLRVRITQPRNVRRLRLYWGLMHKIHENMDNPPPLETLHEAIKVRLGYTETIRFKGGEVVTLPASIAFDKMKEPEFVEFMDRFKRFLCEVVIPGLNSRALEEAAAEILKEAA